MSIVFLISCKTEEASVISGANSQFYYFNPVSGNDNNTGLPLSSGFNPQTKVGKYTHDIPNKRNGLEIYDW